MPSVIDVQMVDLKDIPDNPTAKGDNAKASEAPAEKKAPEPEKDIVEEKHEAPAVAEKESKPEISTAPKKKETKVALKYKTFKSKRVLKKALSRIEKQVEDSPPRPLEETIKQLREKVEKGEKYTKNTNADVDASEKSGRADGVAAHGSKQEVELIELYRLDIAYEIQKNWAYADQLGGGGKNLVTSIVFKVMPDGKITDIFYTDRSGNSYLDESAYKAIVKSSPVKPHPKELARPSVEMGLRFGPEGIR